MKFKLKNNYYFISSIHKPCHYSVFGWYKLMFGILKTSSTEGEEGVFKGIKFHFWLPIY